MWHYHVPPIFIGIVGNSARLFTLCEWDWDMSQAIVPVPTADIRKQDVGKIIAAFTVEISWDVVLTLRPVHGNLTERIDLTYDARAHVFVKINWRWQTQAVNCVCVLLAGAGFLIEAQRTRIVLVFARRCVQTVSTRICHSFRHVHITRGTIRTVSYLFRLKRSHCYLSISNRPPPLLSDTDE